MTFLYLISISLLTFAFLNPAITESEKHNIYKGRVYFFTEGENRKSCIDCHTISGIKRDDCPIIVGKKIGLENIMSHINNVVGILNKAEKDSLLLYLKQLMTKSVEKESNAELPRKENEIIDKEVRERLQALGYVGSLVDTYREPLITVKKMVEFSSVELAKYCSLGFQKVRDSLSDIGFSLKSHDKFVKAIVLPVVDLKSDNFFLTLVYRNPITESEAKIELYDYFSGKKINQKNIYLQKTEKIFKKLIIFQEKYQKIFIFIRFHTDDNLEVFGLSLRKLE